MRSRYLFFIFLLSNIYLMFQFKLLNKEFDQTTLRPTFFLLERERIFVNRCIIISLLWWKICGFAVCGLSHLRNLRICDLRINQKKFVDSLTSEICGFEIADWAQEFEDLWFADLQKFLRAHFWSTYKYTIPEWQIQTDKDLHVEDGQAGQEEEQEVDHEAGSSPLV